MTMMTPPPPPSMQAQAAIFDPNLEARVEKLLRDANNAF